MVRKNGAEARKERIQQIAQYIHAKLNDEQEIFLSKIIAELQYRFGLTKERIIEYLEILENLDHFTIDKELGKVKKPTKGAASEDVEGSSHSSE
jgi:hypothetical protein